MAEAPSGPGPVPLRLLPLPPLLKPAQLPSLLSALFSAASAHSSLPLLTPSPSRASIRSFPGTDEVAVTALHLLVAPELPYKTLVLLPGAADAALQCDAVLAASPRPPVPLLGPFVCSVVNNVLVSLFPWLHAVKTNSFGRLDEVCIASSERVVR